jgi:hypothetical protein
LLLSTSVFAQTKVREGNQTMGALPVSQGGVLSGGSTNQVLKKNSNTDYDLVWGSASSVTPAALTKIDDTNVTLSLGGTPATALLQATSLTLGWTGTLAASRGGTGVSSLGDITKVDDTNVTLTLGGTPVGAVVSSTSFTLGWSGTLAINRGGTGAATSGAHTFFANNTGSTGAPSFTSFVAGTNYWDTTVFTGATSIGLVPPANGVPTCLRFLDESGTWSCASGGSSGGAPDDASYLTAKAESGLTSEINLGALTTGLLKGTVSGSISTVSSITDNSSNWNTAYTDRLKWDGGATDLVPATGRTSLGATTVGSNIFTLTNPSAISFVKIAADNSVSTRTPTQVVSDLSLTIGTNTQAWDTQLDSLASLSYTGNSLKVVRVNVGESGFELATVTSSPGGSDTQIQFNDSSSFGGDSDFTWNKTSNVLTDLGTLELGAASDTTIARSSAGHISIEGSVVGLASNDLSFFTTSTSNTIGVGNIELGHATDTTLSRNAAGVLQVEGVVVPTISSTNTITNKRNTKRALSTSGPGGTPTLNTDTYDVAHFTALAAAITSMTTNLSGTPVQGDQLRLDFTDDGTARAIAWGTSFEDGGVALPLTTAISTRLDVILYWNTVTSKWRCMATSVFLGTATNDNAPAGAVGEYTSSLVASGSAVSLSNNTGANITSISLTAGDWDVGGSVNFTETTSTVTGRSAGVTSTTATVPTDGSEAFCGVQSTVTSETNSITLSRKRFSLSATTTIYLVAKASFSAGTCAGFGQITARRAR